MSEKAVQQQPSSKGKLKFIIGAIIGAFLFLAPIPTGDGGFNIPLGFGIDWLNSVLIINMPAGLEVNWLSPVFLDDYGILETLDLRLVLAYIFIIVSFLMTLVAYIFKPRFIMENEKVKEVLMTSPLYAITRLIAFFAMTFTIFNITFGTYVEDGSWLVNLPYTLSTAFIDRWDGAGLMVFDLITGLTTIFLLLAFCIPILTEFGLMEFIGVLIKKFVNKFFTLPGRASVDLAASWFGSSAVSVILTRGQHEKGFYTGREAVAICVNFAFVSLPFSLVIAGAVGVQSHFALWYLMISIVCIILGVITPRIWPLKQIPDTYLEGVDKQIDEEVEVGESRFRKALFLASERAEQTTANDVIFGGLHGWFSAFLDLFPVIVAWGTIALMINNLTPFIDWIAWPMGLLLEVFQVPGGSDYAAITVIGFIDMFLPAIFLGEETYFNTRFILGALSIVQIIYMAETGVLILKSKMPIGFGKLFIVFIMRTVMALPLIVLFTWIFSALGLI